ncbi:MAG: DUF115 domain-containing protein [Treponema sp.]
MPSLRLHSQYNPHKEAEQFVSALEGFPRIIVISEPGESYLAAAFRQHFPGTKLIAIRYTPSLFSDSDYLWDAVWRPANGNLTFFLVSHIPDEKLGSVRFVNWKPADKAFPEAAAAVWEDIRTAIGIIKSIMHTRTFFGNRWLNNTVHNFIHLNRPAAADFGTKPFILAGAGPSLQQLNKKDTAGFSVAAVCSAYAALAAQHIHPDICIGTDGGYWALRHFDRVPATAPIAFPLEAAVPAAVLEHNPCIPLSYASPLEQHLFAAAGFLPLPARENGTVMGTACELLLAQTGGSIILTGLDLAPSKGFSHAQPHESTKRILHTAGRLRPLADLLAVQNFQTASLETYRHWFLQLPPQKTGRLFRTGTGGCDLPNIRRIASPAETLKQTRRQKQAGVQRPFSVHSSPTRPPAERKRALRELFSAVQERVQTFSAEQPDIITGNEPSIEKQICALCSYTVYCSFIKDTANQEIRSKLCEDVSRVLNRLIARTDNDGF